METRSNPERSARRRPPWGKRLRRLLTAVILVGTLLALAAALVMQRIDELIRAHVECKLDSQLADVTVTIRAARRVPGQGVELRGISIVDPTQPAAARELVYIDEVLAECPTDLQGLWKGPPTIRRLVIRRLRVRAARAAQGGWNLDQLLPLPNLGGAKPSAVVENATVEIIDLEDPTAEAFTIRDVNLTVTPRQIQSARGPREVLAVTGDLVGEHFKRIRLRGQVDPEAGNWSAHGHVAELQMSSRLLANLPGELAKALAPLTTLRARADLDFTLENPQTEGGLPRFVVSGRLAEGRFDDERLPYPLTDLRAELYCDSHGLRIDGLRARTGRTTLELSLRCQGYERTSPYTLRARARNLLLDRRLYETLPNDLRKLWNDYDFGGTVNADVTLSFDGHKHHPNVVVECLDLAFSIPDFKYPMHNGQGTIRFDGVKLSTSDFRARVGSQWVQLEGLVERPGIEWTGWIEARGKGRMAIDETLLDALEDRTAKVLRELRPSGSMSLIYARYERFDPQGGVRQQLELELHEGSIEYSGFPYPIHNIHGKLLARDGHWTFRDLVGRNDTAYIVCDGKWEPYPDVGGRLALDFDCRSVPLEDELRLALDAGGQEVWANLRPRGIIDQLGIRLVHDSRADKLKVEVDAQQWPPRHNVPGRSLSVFPTYFPYRMDNLTGAVSYRDGVVRLHSLRAAHDRTDLRISGTFQRLDRKNWELRFDELIADGLVADHELLAALPSGLGQAMAHMQLKGTINLRGVDSQNTPPTVGPVPRRPTTPALTLRGGGAGTPLQADWNVALDVENGQLNCGLNLEHLRGGVRLRGRLDGTGVHSRGDLAIDSMIVKGVHVTRVRGPLWIEPNHVQLGLPGRPGTRRGSPAPITGTAFGGQLSLHGRSSTGGDRRFGVTLSLNGADLAEISRDALPKERRISGQAEGRLTLTGVADRPHTFQGGGSVQLSDADIYELPVMVALLKLLSVRRPNTTAFTSSNIKFRVQGEDVYFDPIDFRGDAISLIGKGWMDLNQQIHLTFYTQVGRREFPLLGSVLAEASRNILEIQVVGTLDDPLVQQTAFPELDETLQRLFPDAARRGDAWNGWFGNRQRRDAAKRVNPTVRGGQ